MVLQHHHDKRPGPLQSQDLQPQRAGERPAKRLERPGAVGDPVLDLDPEFRHRPAVFGHDEKRIVPEALRAAPLETDQSVAGAVGFGDDLSARVDHDDGGAIARGPRGRRDAAKIRKQLVVVRLIAPAGIARRVNAGAAVERIDLEARVVRQRPLAAETRTLDGFLARILGERL